MADSIDKYTSVNAETGGKVFEWIQAPQSIKREKLLQIANKQLRYDQQFESYKELRDYVYSITRIEPKEERRWQ